MSVISRVVLACVVGVAMALACLLIGIILAGLNVPVVHDIGTFMVRMSWLIGLINGLWFLFTGRTP